MSLFTKKEEHAGSGLDKPEPKSLLDRIADKLKANPPSPSAINKATASKPPVS